VNVSMFYDFQIFSVFGLFCQLAYFLEVAGINFFGLAYFSTRKILTYSMQNVKP